MIGKRTAALLTILLLAACAVRLGGPDDEDYRTLGLAVPAGADAGAVASQVGAADVTFLTAEADSAWFAEVARQSGRTLSGPGRAGDRSLAFLAGEPVGDTTVALPLADGERTVIVHDALYRVDDERYLDLLAFRADRSVPTDAAVRALLRYMATDVAQDAAVVVAVEAADAATAERLVRALRPALTDARECLPQDDDDAADSLPAVGMMLFYGPELRIRCERAELQAGDGNSLLARLVVRR